ncbi:uncharacterized protein LOC100902119, partial [Galendromus occidentalis]|uniref:Uncharacterized protein LOC100902119 n=1 Tax=Galendromus occidentalis TaxID=34638 RepID=A0AAJ7P988_9ACAR
LTDPPDKAMQDSNFEMVRVPAPPATLTAIPLTTSTVRLQWSPGSTSFAALSFAIERPHRASRRTSEHSTIEDDLKYFTNTTICVRERRRDTEHLLVLESEATCLSNVRGLPPRPMKPLYVAFVELVALSLVVSAIACIFVHFGLEYLKKSLSDSDRRDDGEERPFDDCLKTWLREDEEDKEPDERSRIICANRATSV